MKKTIYKINVLNFDKYNSKLKKGHKCVLVSTNFLSDAKIRSLSPVTRLLYLSCILVAGESTNSQIEVSHESLTFQSGVKSSSIQSQLDQLQSLQLLTYDKFDPLINRIEKNRIESKGIEKKGRESKSTKVDPPSNDFSLKIQESLPEIKTHKLIEIWNDYCGSLSKVLKSSPGRNKKINVVWKELNEAEWIEVIKKIAASDFCNGKNDRGWKANFDFLIKPGTWLKAQEGVYDGKRGQYGMTEDGRYITNAVKRSHNNKIMMEKYLKPQGAENEQITDVGPDSVDS